MRHPKTCPHVVWTEADDDTYIVTVYRDTPAWRAEADKWDKWWQMSHDVLHSHFLAQYEVKTMADGPQPRHLDRIQADFDGPVVFVY